MAGDDPRLDAVVSRLEAIAIRLEKTEVLLSPHSHPAPAIRSTPPAAAPRAPAASAASATPATSGATSAYSQLVLPRVKQVLDAAEAVGGEVLKASRSLAAGFEAEGAVVQATEQCQRPSDAELQQLVQPVGQQLVAAQALVDGPRSKYLNHFKLVAEAMQGLTWVVYTGPACGMQPPPLHVQESWAAAEFYANKVLMEWKAKDPAHVPWVQAVKELMLGLKAFCAEHYPAGLTWKAGGIPVSQFKPGTVAPAAGSPAAAQPAAAPKPPPPVPKAAAGSAGRPPPPPPMPAGGPGSLIEKAQPTAAASGPKPAAAGANMSALFADINKGDGITAGLKKVTADMKAKNRADRSGVVPAAAVAGTAKPGGAPKAATAGADGPSGPPRLECEQERKWVVENQRDNREIVISDTQPKQTVYVYNCVNSTVQVRGKVAAISMDKCRRVGLVFENVVASCEVVNCANVEVQCTGRVATVAIDKSDGCQVYLSKTSLEAEVTTAKSSEVNIVILPGEGEEGDPTEVAIPEQFVTRYRDGKWVTEAVSHSGG